jgi:uncharacterized membrane protein
MAIETLVNTAHLHLLLNHVPTVGTVVAIGLLLLALVRRNDHLKHASLETFFIVALLTLPAYLTGVAAQTAIEGRDGVEQAIVDLHHDAAIFAFILMQITGAVAWVALWQFRRRGYPAGWSIPAVLVLAVLTISVMGRTATLGGEIRHQEIRIEDATPAVPGAGWLTKDGIQRLVTENPWVWPAAETLHFIGLCMVIGILGLVNLRMMGVMKGIPFAALHRLLPWGLLAFGVNLVTGMLFFIATPEQYTMNGPFYWKMLFLMLAGGDFLYLTVKAKAFSLAAGEDPPVFDKAIAATTVVLWLGVVYWGRMLPFIGNAF